MTSQDKATSRAESGEDVDTLVRSMTDCLKSGHGYYLPMDSISTVAALLASRPAESVDWHTDKQIRRVDRPAESAKEEG
jgi:hypothetical protein